MHNDLDDYDFYDFRLWFLQASSLAYENVTGKNHNVLKMVKYNITSLGET